MHSFVIGSSRLEKMIQGKPFWAEQSWRGGSSFVSPPPRVINAPPGSTARDWILNFLFERRSLEACGEGRPTLPSGGLQMPCLLINPFTIWDLATRRYGNSPVQGWREGEQLQSKGINVPLFLIWSNDRIQRLKRIFLGFNFEFLLHSVWVFSQFISSGWPCSHCLVKTALCRS